jgi:hypothetical protein
MVNGVGWHRRLEMPSGMTGTVDATVTHCAINEALPADTFVGDCPPGTQVCDVTVDKDVAARLASESTGSAKSHGSSMDAIIAGWTRQQSRIRSYRIAWQCEWIRPYREADGPKDEKGKVAIRPEFQRFKSHNTQWVDGNRFAIEQILVDVPKPAPIMRTIKRTFDGQTSQMFFTSDFSETGNGTVRRGFPGDLAEGADAKPPILALRPMVPRLGGIDPANCRVLPFTGRIDGVSCTIMSAQCNGQAFYWLDPARDYVVLREHRMIGGQDHSRIDISYRSDPKIGWIPSGWKEAVIGDQGTFDDLVVSKVTEFAINEPLQDSTFRIVFPKGTILVTQ